jgi:hypothetical protein
MYRVLYYNKGKLSLEKTRNFQTRGEAEQFANTIKNQGGKVISIFKPKSGKKVLKELLGI